VQAVEAKDAEAVDGVRAQIQAFNEKNPNRRINGMNLAMSIKAHAKRVNEAQDGVYLPRKRRDALEEGRFATTD
jgi:citrate lyase beta subunit